MAQCLSGGIAEVRKFYNEYWEGYFVMLETIIIVVLILWLLGLVAGQTFGGVLHALLLVAAVIFIIRLLTGRRAV